MNSRLRTLSLRATLALALTLPAAAQATPVTLLGGQTLLFSIDLSGAAPAPPYTQIEVDFGFDLAASGASAVKFQIFGDVDGGGAGPFTNTHAVSDLDTFGLLLAGSAIEDGLFSFTMETLGGDLRMDVAVQGVLVTTSGELRTDVIEPVGRLVDSPGPGTVPEPSTAALVLLAAAVMVARGSRRTGHRRLAMQPA